MPKDQDLQKDIDKDQAAAAARLRLEAWLAQPLGQRVRLAELALLHERIPNLFGYHALQIGYWGDLREAYADRRISNLHILQDPQGTPVQAASSLLSRLEHLPIATESIDAVILPHVLEVVARPHQLLREVDRILVPEGHMLIMGFNPWSLWGLWRLLGMNRKPFPGSQRFITENRLRDWLNLLGYEIVASHHYFYGPPLRRKGLLASLEFMERWGNRACSPCSGAYLLMARKKVACITPLRPRWRPRRALAAIKLVAPASTRNSR